MIDISIFRWTIDEENHNNLQNNEYDNNQNQDNEEQEHNEQDNANRTPLIVTAYKYTLGPIFKVTGKVIKFVLPKFVKRATCKVFSYFSHPYPSYLFAELLNDNEILNAEFQENEETRINIQTNSFLNSVAEGFEKTMLILFVYGDLSNSDIRELLTALFHDEEIIKVISSHYIVFGVEPESEEAENLSAEFNVNTVPYFGVVICWNDEEYNLIER